MTCRKARVPRELLAHRVELERGGRKRSVWLGFWDHATRQSTRQRLPLPLGEGGEGSARAADGDPVQGDLVAVAADEYACAAAAQGGVRLAGHRNAVDHEAHVVAGGGD